MKNIESGGYFQILRQDNYEQTSGMQLEFFLLKPYAGNTTVN